MMDQVIHIIYRTLLHSLWQGALAAMIAGMIMLGTKKTAPAIRFNLLLGTFSLLVFSIVVTFITLASQINQAPRQTPAVFLQSPATDTTAAFPLADAVNAGNLFLNANARWIVMIWLIVIAIQTFRLWTGLSTIKSLKKQGTFSAGTYREQQLKTLSTQLGIGKCVRLLQSSLVKVPLTVGFIKPVILIPVGLLTSLPPEQIEAILLHELAHIRRNDYVINIIQHIIEIVFFFNPAIRWISFLIKAERENCCDDLVVSSGDNTLHYLKALVAFEQVQKTLPKYATGLTGSRHSLLHRAKRIISKQNKTLHTMEKMMLASTLIVAGLLTIAFNSIPPSRSLQSSAEKIKPADMRDFINKTSVIRLTDTVPSVQAAPANPKNDTFAIKEKMEKEVRVAEKKEVESMKEQAKALEPQAAAAKEEADRQSQAEQEADRVLSSADNRKMHKKIAEEMEHRQKDLLQLQVDLAKEAGRLYAFGAKDLIAKNDKLQAEGAFHQAENSLLQAEAFKDQMEHGLFNAKDMDALSSEAGMADLKDQMAQVQRQMQNMKLQMQKAKQEAEKTREMHLDEKVAAETDRADRLKIHAEALREQIRAAKTDLREAEKAQSELKREKRRKRYAE